MTTPKPASAPQADAIIAFLYGEAPLDGVWFGEASDRAPYWWRRYLPLLAASAQVREGEPLTVATAPIGTRAPAFDGGHWYRTATGWKWNGPDGTGSTFPRPGGDWNGKLIAPAAEPLPWCGLPDEWTQPMKPAAEPLPMLRIEDFYSRQGPRKVYRIPPFEEAEPVPVAQEDGIASQLLNEASDLRGGGYIASIPAHHDCLAALLESASATIADHARRESELEASNAGLAAVARKNRDGFEEYERRYYLEVNAREELEASLAACRADAERYRWLRDPMQPLRDALCADDLCSDDLDAAIDSLRQESPHAE